LHVQIADTCRRGRLFALHLTLFVLGWLALTGPGRAAPPTPVSGLGTAPAATPAVVAAPDFAWVQFNHRLLFPVFTSGDQSAQDRADLASLRLADLMRQRLDGADVREAPQVSVDSGAEGTVLRLDKQNLLTVTEADADRAGVPPVMLAGTWTQKINSALREALRERRPAYLRWAARQAVFLALIGLGLHALLWLAGRGLHERFRWPLPTLIWVVVLARIVDLFPQTRPLLPFLLTGWPRPLALAVIIGLPTASLARVWGIVLRRIFPAQTEHPAGHDLAHRSILRRITLAGVAEVTGTTLLWFVAILIGLTWYGVNLSALLASAGLIGVALGLVAQDTLRDIIAGVSILTDDRFGVGDTIQVGTWSGKVERLNLRVTQMRDNEGRLITLSNRSITEVANLTAHWAQVDFRIGVSYYSDVHRAIDVLTQTAQTLADEWPERLPAPPEILGVDAFTEQNVTLRLLLRTAPGDQWAVARELRLRVKSAFDSAGIAVLNSLYAPPPAPASPPVSSHLS